jgi:hypothetical protein
MYCVQYIAQNGAFVTSLLGGGDYLAFTPPGHFNSAEIVGGTRGLGALLGSRASAAGNQASVSQSVSP